MSSFEDRIREAREKIAEADAVVIGVHPTSTTS